MMCERGLALLETYHLKCRLTDGKDRIIVGIRHYEGALRGDRRHQSEAGEKDQAEA